MDESTVIDWRYEDNHSQEDIFQGRFSLTS